MIHLIPSQIPIDFEAFVETLPFDSSQWMVSFLQIIKSIYVYIINSTY